MANRPSFATDSRPSSHRAPRKKSSLLSIKRDKSKPSEAGYSADIQDRAPPSSQKSAPYIPHVHVHSGRSSNTNPEAFLPSRTGRSPSQASSSRSLPHSSGIQVDGTRKGRWTPSDEALYAFPNMGSLQNYLDDDYDSTVKVSRPRQRANLSQVSSDWRGSQLGSAYRISGSSTQTQVEESPPQTPLDTSPFRSTMGRVSVVVAAPIAGVETMDALVDGMNGFGDDESCMNVSSVPSPSRSKQRRKGHHPLYHPPLPTPPPGVVLGRGPRRDTSPPAHSDSEDDSPKPARTKRPPRRKVRHASSPSKVDSSTVVSVSSPRSLQSAEGGQEPEQTTPSMKHRFPSLENEHEKGQEVRRKTIVPSITEIIQAHAPTVQRTSSRPGSSRPGSSRASSFTYSSHGHSFYSNSNGHTLVAEEEEEPEPEPLTAEEEAELISRSSIDSIAQEIQDTIRKQSVSPTMPRHLQHAHTFPKRHSIASDDGFSVHSPVSGVIREPSLYSSSTPSTHVDQPPIASLAAAMQPTQSQKIAQYLNSTRLTTLLKLTRSPHASADKPLTISLSDLGCPTGVPLVVFLGLGCVRHIMGLYDEMADLLGIRLITIDRWGLGRTETPRSKTARGIPEWATVVEEVLDRLNIHQCSIMAHSAGAPYALAFANKAPERIRGDICLLAPWIGGGEGAGYKWLKYVPNGILKTAQQAEWKVQGWMLGKPPKVRYQGIGYTPDPPPHLKREASKRDGDHHDRSLGNVYPSLESRPRPSVGSSNFSEYDDLADFAGRFESRSTLGARQGPALNRSSSEGLAGKRKTSKGFLGRLRGDSSQPQSPLVSGKKIRPLKSMTSLKSKASSVPSTLSKVAAPTESPQLPDPLNVEFGLGFDAIDWPIQSAISSFVEGNAAHEADTSRCRPRSAGRRSISLTTPRAARSLKPSPTSSTFTAQPNDDSSEMSYQTALGNALIAASHSESSKGTHSDLLQILNHDHQPWGFSYSTYPHRVNVWYGDKDERIAENSVRWMEKAMGEDRCEVNVVSGADHSLMFRSSVVIEVLERVKRYWQDLS